ncbi:uncharacterized protein LOC126236535 [Schistocerca nitens]|uniref:uncharacterized protein LOC126236535 n=1 Tax=Schistocerca nitens TaxID=7011 RepID=UPI0021177CD7|nr:uncharacterized protein LOC126236535 [Schistocerca nitens]
MKVVLLFVAANTNHRGTLPDNRTPLPSSGGILPSGRVVLRVNRISLQFSIFTLAAGTVTIGSSGGGPRATPTTASILNENLSTGNITAENRFLARSSYTEDDDDTICVEADNKLYLYASSLKLYSCYNQLPKVYVVKPKNQCKPYLSHCPRN